MKRRLVQILLCAGLAGVATLTAFTLPAAAEKRTITVKLLNGRIVTLQIDVPPGTPLSQIQVPGVLENTPAPGAPAPQPGAPGQVAPKPGAGTQQAPGGGDRGPAAEDGKKRRRRGGDKGGTGGTPFTGGTKARRRPQRTPMRNADGSPAPTNPGFIDALPGPSFATGVPNFVIRKFRVPIFLLPIYQAAGIQYGVRWEILAAINEIETDYGRNLNVSSAGALGWMQFIPSSWRMYGVDANKDGKKDPYNPVDAIFAAARYLKAAGYEKDVRRSVFAYNHADWYVDSVMLRARLIAGVPADLVGSLTGLTEGRFPVAARARYADDLKEREATKRVKRGQNAANVIKSQDDRRAVEIFARRGSPVVATNDGVIKKMGSKPGLGRYVVLQDVYGNRYMYSGLGTVAKHYPVPKQDAENPTKEARALKANAKGGDAKPRKPASAGRQPDVDDSRPVRKGTHRPAPAASAPVKERLFAHPNIPGAREAGGLEQLLDSKLRRQGGFETYRNYFSRPFGADAKDVRLRRMKVGSKVIGGTILGRVGAPSAGKASNIDFEIRPAGRGAPRIDPKPILDGWKLLEATAIYRASGKNVLYGDEKSDGFSIGQILLLPKPLLERRVLSDQRIDVYPCGRDDIKSGQIDRRVLATMAYLAESGLRPTVTSLKCGHGFFTSSGSVSHHSSGNAVDIAKINGVPIIGHQEPGGVTDTAVRRLMRLQGTMAPDQIISLLEIGGSTIAMGDHADHIHVGFRPLFGSNGKLGRQALAVLKPGQWSNLLDRLRKIENPVVPTKPSKYAIKVPKKKRASRAHQGE
ncbi:MAG TPA: lytic murein transglycosylase [Thermoleophilaceae bacterium]|nr:lytic murein transglycosylase [Thermoleophilaceae bacterium]